MEIILKSEQDLPKLVKSYIELSQDIKVAFLYGDLGAGKTTFVKALVRALGSKDEASSPTYSLVNEYRIQEGNLYHIDLYRLNSEEEALDIGIEDYIYSNDYCLIEWPQVIEHLVDAYIRLSIETLEDESRKVQIEVINS